MACALTQSYNLDCRDSNGGVKEVYIMEFEKASAITVALGAVTVLTKTAASLFRKYSLISHTAEGDETVTASRENGTVMVKQSVKFPVNKMTTSVRNEILLLLQNRLLVVVVDQNGQGYLYGKDFGMMANNIAAKTGKTLADRNGYEIALESDEKTLAPTLAQSVIDSLVVAGV